MKLVYMLKNQSELFSEPQVYETDDRIKLTEAIRIANINGYKILDIQF